MHVGIAVPRFEALMVYVLRPWLYSTEALLKRWLTPFNKAFTSPSKIYIGHSRDSLIINKPQQFHFDLQTHAYVPRSTNTAPSLNREMKMEATPFAKTARSSLLPCAESLSITLHLTATYKIYPLGMFNFEKHGQRDFYPFSENKFIRLG